tara:strand:+ start:194888 stop:196306 length:1419 start_codon:yes stop_codon:yes gene_type:complete
MKKFLAISFVLFFSGAIWAQEHPNVEYKIKGKDLICIIDKDLPLASLDSLLATFGLRQDSLAIMWKNGLANEQLWKVAEIKSDRIVLQKSLEKLVGKASSQREMLSLLGEEDYLTRPANYTYGVNHFKKPAVIQLDNGLTRFYLKVEGLRPESVYLSGSFNDWSTSATALRRCDSGYYVDLKLEVGPHLYKYIVDGYWLLDPRNLNSEFDFMGNENSLYFNYNYRFFLANHAGAEAVSWASSANYWNEDPMRACKGGWELNLYLKEGTHAYKFVVDDEWILDPKNPVTRRDDEGNLNSFVSIGDTFYFYYPFDLDAEMVHVTGNFNVWSRSELSMEKSDTGWVLPYVLPAGNYEYKFIVNQSGEFKLDPLNPLRIGWGSYQNSVLSIEANTEFFYPLANGVEEVILTGSFIDWREDGFRLTKEIDGWHADVHLPKGKSTYRFIVNGQWMQDPNNPLYEPNEYQEFNSVIWVK